MPQRSSGPSCCGSTLTEFTESDSLRKHALAVEAAMRAYAARYGVDPETWGAAGLLHDFDYEMHPAAPQHPMKGAEILLAREVPLGIVHAVLAHADYSGYPRVSLLDHGLYACDELSGFITACALVRPGRANFPRAVVSFIAGISLLDGLLMARAGRSDAAAWGVAGFGLTLLLQRYVRGT